MKTRRPFNIDTYSPLKHYETRDGRPAHIINTKLEGNSDDKFPVMAIVPTPIEANYFRFTNYGEFNPGNPSDADLFEVPTKIYAVLFKKALEGEWFCYCNTFKTREEAENVARELFVMKTRIEEVED